MEDYLPPVCPHLGTKHDKNTSFGYPSDGNYCYHCRYPSTPLFEHQEEKCLSSRHGVCQVYVQDGKRPFPPELLCKDGGVLHPEVSRWVKLILVIIFIAIAVTIGYMVYKPYLQALFTALPTPTYARPTATMEMEGIPVTGVSPTDTLTSLLPTYTKGPASPTPLPPTKEPSALPTRTSTATPAESSTKGPSPTGTATRTSTKTSTASKTVAPSATSTASKISTSSKTITASATSTSTVTKTASKTHTKQASLTVTVRPFALEAPFSVNGNTYFMHTVASGESYDVLARNYNTTIEIIQAINYKASTPLWAKSTIVISPGLREIDIGIPAFQTYQVIEKTTNLEEMAKKFAVELDLLKTYNQCTTSCELVQGDWLIIPHLRVIE